ncbi:glycosyltransferase [Flavicella sediminum]|uniref:glycosyltransferase n=1 Tax=Flavicella sediminum TaxID=2585141 RepID=UPI001120D746|nr:glycosyltransferase [Flavicella sediminum]
MSHTPKSTRKKICLVTISLANGGAERCTALLSTLLYQEGFEVHIVCLTQHIDYEYSGNLFCLYAQKNNSLPQRFSRFKKYLQKEQFDCILDSRTRSSNVKEFLYLHYLYKANKVIYVVHSYNLSEYFPPSKLLTKAMINKSEAIVSVSKAISEKINTKFPSSKNKYIYNPISEEGISTDLPKTEKSAEKYILYLGRIQESVKNLSLLLDAYKASNLAQKNIRLKILGDGPDLHLVKSKTTELSLDTHVELIPYTPHVTPYLKSALFQVLTSRYEGFPRVLIEALAVGTPVVSVDCKSGPNEIICHEHNGLLVENYNVTKLANAFNRFIDDKELYLHCKKNAKSSVAHLKPNIIAKKWTELLTSLHK